VFEAKLVGQHPSGMRETFGDFASKFWREVGDYLIEGRVAMAAVEKFEEMCAEGLIVVHESSVKKIL